MKQYPSIKTLSKDNIPKIPIIMFLKYDGSLIRSEWNSKRGFYKFGTKTQLMDENSKPFGVAVNLIKNKYEKDLSKVFAEHKWKDAICFFELWGPDSFAGNHNFDKPLDTILFDINPYKQGILPPDQFIKYFGHLDIAQVLYEG